MTRRFIFPFLPAIIAFAAFTFSAPAQQIDTTRTGPDIQDEELLENLTGDQEDSQVLDRLEDLAAHPVDLNLADLSTLQTIPGLTPMIAASIIGYREKYGPFTQFGDLARVPGMDRQTLELLQRFGTLSTTETQAPLLGKTTVEFRSRVMQDLETARGYLEGKYPGTKMKQYNRFQLTVGEHFRFGVLTEKDAGEPRLADFFTTFLEVKNVGFADVFVAGDYNVSAGQGIVLWRNSGFSKSVETISSIKRSSSLISPYRSSLENGFFRGAAWEKQFGALQAAAFFSTHTYDARLDSLTGAAGSFDESGLHRTVTERAKEDNVSETLVGAHVSVRITNPWVSGEMGISGYSSTFDREIRPSSPGAFEGTSASAVGLDYNLMVSGTNLFGEWARSHTKAIGGVSGLSTRLFDGFDLSLLYRYFPADFVSLHGYAFGERNGGTRNEEGMYLGLKYRLFRTLTLRGYMDVFRFPGRTYFNPLPASGKDLLVQTDWRFAARTLLTLRYREKVKDDPITIVDPENRRIITNRTQRNLRAEIMYQPARFFRVRSRVEFVRVDWATGLSSESGMLAFLDIRYRPRPDVQVYARVIGFRTDSYESRVYEYENDLRGVFANSALYGSGQHFYILLLWEAFHGMRFSAKYSRLVRDNVRSLRSGYDEIAGDELSRISIQVEFRY
ncbi:MAG: helix-hairpin-helix domain-containing protein [Chlorobi bacterium]|nr:helix-hairpin-helix domain-containing protein [Chlorobiota bacterium]